jgi:hypothetical protein
MENSTTFVTCIYDDLFETELGGRPQPTTRYFYGVESMLKMNSPFVIFTWKKDVVRVEEFFTTFLGEEKFNKLIKVLEFDLYNTDFRDMIKEERKINQTLSGDRCYDLMISKFLMLKISIEKNPFDSDRFFWVDAGLSHQSLFPDKYLDLNSGDRRWSYCSLFTPKVVENLRIKSENKILLLLLNYSSGCKTCHLPKEEYGFNIIGGLFGGKKEDLYSFCEDNVKSFKSYLIDENTIYTEEQIMTIKYSWNEENFEVIEFDIWYHENSGEWVREFIKGKKNFYKIFEKLNT